MFTFLTIGLSVFTTVPARFLTLIVTVAVPPLAPTSTTLYLSVAG